MPCLLCVHAPVSLIKNQREDAFILMSMAAGTANHKQIANQAVLYSNIPRHYFKHERNGCFRQKMYLSPSCVGGIARVC